jgi:hypothetical protein
MQASIAWNQRASIKDEAMSLMRLIEMFDKASEAIKYPKIKNLSIDNRVLTLYRTGERSKYPGSISVTTAQGQWLGNITRQGTFWASREAQPWVAEVLQKLAENPEAIASAHGKKTGNCCFCSRLLTDEVSIALGYGKICGQRYGLIWGETEKKNKPTKKHSKNFKKKKTH